MLIRFILEPHTEERISCEKLYGTRLVYAVLVVIVVVALAKL